MTVSNALPIQFWPVTQQTYNEKEVCGIDPVCWCQPVQCDDTLLFYIDDDDPESISLAVLDENGIIVYDPHGFGSNGTHFFTPEDQDLCDGLYQIKIYTIAQAITVDPADEWVPETGSFTSRTADTFNKTSSGEPSVSATQSFPVPSGDRIVIKTFTTITGVWTGSIQVVMRFDNGDVISINGQPTSDVSQYIFSSNVVSFESEWLLESLGATLVELFIVPGVISGTANISVSIEQGEFLYLPQNAILYKSDCIDIRTEHECTELITYTNSSPFMGINYDVTSPALEFSVRVPTVFFHETFPREDEVHPLSNDTYLRLNSILSRKKKLDLGFMPYYMIQKMNLIFMHDTIEIDGEEWVVQDTYEVDEGGKRYPLKRSSVLMTDKNFIERNLI